MTSLRMMNDEIKPGDMIELSEYTDPPRDTYARVESRRETDSSLDLVVTEYGDDGVQFVGVPLRVPREGTIRRKLTADDN